MISNLSKGNRAMVKIILGFAQNTKYILPDESFSGTHDINYFIINII